MKGPLGRWGVGTGIRGREGRADADRGEDSILLTVHGAFGVGEMIIEAGAMEEAVNGIEEQFAAQGESALAGLAARPVDTDGDIGIDGPGLARGGEGQDVSGLGFPEVAVVESAHEVVVDDEHTDADGVMRDMSERGEELGLDPIRINGIGDAGHHGDGHIGHR